MYGGRDRGYLKVGEDLFKWELDQFLLYSRVFFGIDKNIVLIGYGKDQFLSFKI